MRYRIIQKLLVGYHFNLEVMAKSLLQRATISYASLTSVVTQQVVL